MFLEEMRIRYVVSDLTYDNTFLRHVTSKNSQIFKNLFLQIVKVKGQPQGQGQGQGQGNKSRSHVNQVTILYAIVVIPFIIYEYWKSDPLYTISFECTRTKLTMPLTFGLWPLTFDLDLSQ